MFLSENRLHSNVNATLELKSSCVNRCKCLKPFSRRLYPFIKRLLPYSKIIAVVWLPRRRQKYDIIFASTKHVLTLKYALFVKSCSSKEQSEMRAVLLFLCISTSVPVIRGTLSKTDGKKLSKVQEAEVRTRTTSLLNKPS